MPNTWPLRSLVLSKLILASSVTTAQEREGDPVATNGPTEETLFTESRPRDDAALASALVRVVALRDVQSRVVRGRSVRRRISMPDVRFGTGLAVDARGVIATAASLVEEARHVIVRHDEELWPAEVAHIEGGVALLVVLRAAPIAVVSLQEEPSVVDLEAPRELEEGAEPGVADPPSCSRLMMRDPATGALEATAAVHAHDDDASATWQVESLPDGARGGALVGASGVVGLVVEAEAGGSTFRTLAWARVRGALDDAQRSGGLARAQRVLRAEAEARHRDAGLVQWIVEQRPSALRAAASLGEASRGSSDQAPPDPSSSSDIASLGADASSLSDLVALGSATEDATLLAYIAASLWDAHIIALEHAGGHATAAGLPEDARAFVLRARAEGRQLAMRARRQDPDIVDRSPLVAYLTGARGGHMSGEPRVIAEPDRGWFPALQIGYGHHRGRERHVGHAFQLSGSAPVLLSADPNAILRTALSLGLGLDWSSFRALERGAENYETLGVFAVVEVALRVGGPREALLVQLAWLPGGQRGCEECDGGWSRALASFRLAAGFSAGRFNIGLVWRIAAVRAQQAELVRQLGAHLGVTF